MKKYIQNILHILLFFLVSQMYSQSNNNVFNFRTVYCKGESIPNLPSSYSYGGYTYWGNWSPSRVSNTISQRYVFTPINVPGLPYGSVQYLDITINEIKSSIFSQHLPICQDSEPDLPTVSLDGVRGTWSRTFDSREQAIFTFTPDSGQCASTTTMTILKYMPELVQPSFAQIAPVCQGSAVVLPKVSLNGFAGTWSPAFNSNVTTTYAFTPNTWICGPTNYMTVEILPGEIATFNQVAPICKGEPLTPLPTTSINGITGSWSPALNNTETTTYFFTPNNGACSSTMTIEVIPSITPTFNQVAPICQGSTLPALPTSSTNGIRGTWSPALNNNATTTYTFTPLAGQCASATTMTITVNPLVVPQFTPVGAKCQNSQLAPLPTVSNNGIRGTWSPALNNMTTTTYAFTPANGQCVSSSSLTTMTIEILPLVQPTFVQINPVCQGATIALPTTSTNGITGTWSPAINNTTTTTYTFTPTSGQCASTTTMIIQVVPKVSPTFSQVAPVCQGNSIAPLPTTSSNGITGTWSPAINNATTTTYTFTPSSGQCASTTTMTIQVVPKVSPTFSQVAPVCQGNSIAPLPTTSTNGITGTWSPAINNTTTTTYTFTPTSGQCASTTTMTIQVVPKVSPIFSQVAPVCQGNSIAPLPTTSSNGITGTWSPAINNTTTTTYTFTPASGQCASTTTMTIEVKPLVVPTFTQIGPICVGTKLAPLPNVSTNGIQGVWSPDLNGITTTTYTFTPSNSCASTTTMTVVVLDSDSPQCRSRSCLNEIILSNSESNAYYVYQSLNKIETNTNYILDSGKEIYFKSQNAIYLKPNTRIVAGSKFRAKIEPCSQNTTAKEDGATKEVSDFETEKSKFENSIIMYPIPAKSSITITSNDAMIKGVKINSLDGKLLVKKTSNESQVTIDVSGYKSGVYFVEIKTADNQIVKKKFIKE